MDHVIPVSGVLILGTLFLLLRIGRYERHERTLLLVAAVSRIVAMFAQAWVANYYSGSDTWNFEVVGQDIARALEYDFMGIAVENLKLLLHLDCEMPLDLAFGTGSSSSSMCAIAGFLLFALGRSLHAVNLAVGFIALLGSISLYDVFRHEFPARLRTRLLIATTLVPSVIYWSTGLLKEGIVMAAVGPGVLGVRDMLRSRRLVGAVRVAVAGAFIWLVKPYVMFPLVIAAMAWVYTDKASKLGTEMHAFFARPIYLVGALAIASLGVIALGNLAPQFAVERFADEAERYRDAAQQIGGGSNFDLGPTRGFWGQISAVPIAFASAFFRPFIFEARNVPMLVSALEMTVLTVLFVRSLWSRPLVASFRRIRSAPLLSFCAVFSPLFGLALGLVVINLGSLARYRAPMMPFFVALVLVLSAKEEEREGADEDADEQVGHAGPEFDTVGETCSHSVARLEPPR